MQANLSVHRPEMSSAQKRELETEVERLLSWVHIHNSKHTNTFTVH